KLVDPVIGFAGIDDRHGSGVIPDFLFVLGQARIDLVTPYAATNIQRRFRIATSRQSPQDVFQIEGIDIFIDDDYKPAVIACGSTQSSVGRSHGMSRISLLDGDDGHAPGVIYAYDIGDS